MFSKFSVLMSLYIKERPEFLRESLESVFSQTLMPDEVVLVLDGPISYELKKVVDEYSQKYSQLKVDPLAKNHGLGGALNEGLKHCTHDLVIRMDTDDISKPDRFEKQVRFMDSHPDVDVCSSWVDEFIGNRDNVVSIKKLPESHEDLYEFGKTRCPACHPAVIFRKNQALKVGGYGPFPEDYYLWGKMMKNGNRFYTIQESLVWFRSSPDVYKRRGGWKYFVAIMGVSKELHRIGYISIKDYLKVLAMRSVLCLTPNSVRGMLYNRVVRRKDNQIG